MDISLLGVHTEDDAMAALDAAVRFAQFQPPAHPGIRDGTIYAGRFLVYRTVSGMIVVRNLVKEKS